MHVCMTKVISLSDDAYEILKKQKIEGESFSQVIRRITKKKVDFTSFAGTISEERAKKKKKNILRDRENFKSRDFR